MSERLKEIWQGFEATTRRHLTGGGVDNITVPSRLDYANEPIEAEDDALAPSYAAFAALQELRGAKSKSKKKRKKKTGAGAGEDGLHEPLPMAEREFDGDELIQGLRATAMRVERPESDYGAFISTREGKAIYNKHKKKKRFIFF